MPRLRTAVLASALAFIVTQSACKSRSREMKNAETYIQVNEPGKAKELLELELQANPKNADAYVMLGRVFLISGDEPDGRAAFDKAILLDAGTKDEISKGYFEAARKIVESIPRGEISPLVQHYLQEATTFDPGLKGKIVDWALKTTKNRVAAERTTAPIALLQAVSQVDPTARDRLAEVLQNAAKAYADKHFLKESAMYALAAGEQSPARLPELGTSLRNVCTLLPPADRSFALTCLEKAVQWNSALANDDDVFWLTHVGLKPDPGPGVTEYLAKFQNGKHAAEAKSILADRENAAAQEAKSRADLTYANRDCDGTEDGQPGSLYRDLSQGKIDRFTIELRPGCFTGYILLPQFWEYYRMEATGSIQNWWLAYKWYQSKNSSSGQNPPLQAAQLATMRHGSHKIRVQGHGELLFSPTDVSAVAPRLMPPVEPSRVPGSGANFSGGAYKIGGGVSAPVPTYKPEPEYSEEARRAKFQGTVVLFVVVDESGNPRDLKVIRPVGLGLDQKAIEAVRKWKFRPGMKDGYPVPVQATIEVNFRLL